MSCKSKKRCVLALLSLLLLTGCAAQSGQKGMETPVSTQDEVSSHDVSENSVPGGVAGAEDMTTVENVVEEGMEPVYADSLKDGIYPIEMKSSSSMFRADRCELAVENGAMYAVLYMTSEAYPYMYAGTAQAAAGIDVKSKSGWIPLTDGTFTLPLNALDSGESYAAYSKRKELWYDRTLLFRSDSLPPEAFRVLTTAESLGLADGSYTVEVSLKGGSGRASVESPCVLRAENGTVTVRLIWGSANYDYMIIDGERYDAEIVDGHSVFEIPVLYFDRFLSVKADTTAMSKPYEIDYSVIFYSNTITGESGESR